MVSGGLLGAQRDLLDAARGAGDRSRRARALELAERALAAVDARDRTREAVGALDGPAYVFAFGKAAVPMCRGALDAVEVVAGCAVGPSLDDAGALGPIALHRGGHPAPRDDAPAIARAMLTAAGQVPPGALALCLASGGGSAMLELPADGLTLADVRDVAAQVARAGADIAELNAVRIALSAIKGGGLARAMAGARVVTLVVSDVPGHPPSIVASGPTCEPEVGPDALEVVRRYGLLDALDDRVRARLAAPRNREPVDATTRVIADNDRARRALDVDDRGLLLVGEARSRGAAFAAEPPRDRAWAAGGETTVTLLGPRGRGGRSLELVLGAIAAGWSRGLLLAFGTDGVDGDSGYAGALVDPSVVVRATELGIDPARYLAHHDAASFFDAVGGGLPARPTGTNVADLCIYVP